MKIGDLKRTHQVWRQKEVDLRHGFPSGPDTYYRRIRCGDVLATWPGNEPGGCECGNVFFDVGRCVIDDFDQVEVLATSTVPETPS